MKIANIISVPIVCPGCGKIIHSSLFQILIRSVTCNQCGNLWDTFSIKKEQAMTRILVPPDKIANWVLYFAAGSVLLISLTILLGTQDSLLDRIRGSFIVGGFFAGFWFIALIVNSGTKNFINSFMATREIVLQGRQIIVRSLRKNNPREYFFDCNPENHPHVTSQALQAFEVTLYEILIQAGTNSVRLGAGMGKKVIDEIIPEIESFIQNVTEQTPSLPDELTPIIEALENEGQATIEEQAELVQEQLVSEAQDQTDNDVGTAKAPRPKSIDIYQDENAVALISRALWGTRKWVMAFAGVFTAIMIVILVIRYARVGIGVSIPLAGGFASIFAYFMDIKVKITEKRVIITYQLFGLIKWQRLLKTIDIIAVGDNWDGACALHTGTKSYRISHFTNIKSRTYLTVLLKEFLKERANWQEKNRFKVKREGQKVSKIRIIPGGIRIFDELGIPLPSLLFMSILFIPMSCLVELLIFAALGSFFSFPENFFDQVMPILLITHALIFIYIGIKLMKAPVLISIKDMPDHKAPLHDGKHVSPKNMQKVIEVKRCMWDDVGWFHRFPLQKGDINIRLEQYDFSGNGDRGLHKGFCVIEQNHEKIRFGSLLDWDELTELKSIITEML